MDAELLGWRRSLLGSRADHVGLLVDEWQTRRELLNGIDRQIADRADEQQDLREDLDDDVAKAEVVVQDREQEVRAIRRKVRTLEAEAERLRRKVTGPFNMLWCLLGSLFGGDGPSQVTAAAERLEGEVVVIGEELAIASAALDQAERELHQQRDPLRNVAFALDHLQTNREGVVDSLDRLVDEIDVLLMTSLIDWSLDVWQKALVALPSQADRGDVLRRRDRLRASCRQQLPDETRPPIGAFRPPHAAVAAGFRSDGVPGRVRVRIQGDGHHHVRRTRSGANNSTQTYWKRIDVSFDDRISVDVDVEVSPWQPDSTGAWLGSELQAAFANGWSTAEREGGGDGTSLIARELSWFRQRVAPGIDRLVPDGAEA